MEFDIFRTLSTPRWLIIALALALPRIGCAEPVVSPDSAASLCAGFKKLDLKTTKGLCVGLVASHLGFVRGVAVAEDKLWLVDMGGWRKGHGRLLRISEYGHGKIEVMLTHLDEPNALLTLPNGRILLGSRERVDLFDPRHAEPDHVSLTPILTGLPGIGRHPIPALAAARDGTLYVNIGSATDHCEGVGNSAPDPQKSCPETLEAPPRASIIAARWDHPPDNGLAASQARVVARGLRNSMAMALDASSQLWAAVNARDAINLADPALSDEKLPPDTLVRVIDGADYGWPQCYGMQISSPEYKDFSCKSKSAPTMLLPAHAAPLGMLYLTSEHPLGTLKNGLLIAYHGYRKTGHRIVWQAFNANGGLAGTPVEVVWGWEAPTSGNVNKPEAFSDDGIPQTQGSPVALAQLPNDSVIVSDDHNGTLLIIGSYP